MVVEEADRVVVAWVGTNTSEEKLAALLLDTLGIRVRLEARPDPLRLAGGAGFHVWIEGMSAKDVLIILSRL